VVNCAEVKHTVPEYKSRRTRDAEGARQAILAAAEEHFARYGFSGARIDAIAEDSGYNKSLIFHYFTDKLELYRAVVSCAKGEQESQMDTLLKQYITDEAVPLTRAQVHDFVEAMVHFWFDRMVANPNLRRIYMWEAAEEWQTFTKLPPAPVMHNRSATVALFLRRAQEQGFIRAEADPVILVVNVSCMSMAYLASLTRHTMFFPDLDFTSPAALAHAREQLTQLVLHGTMTPSSPEDF
jgi:TetR/AcrR family transcriptional regulator